jgi:hypothetical protein
MYSFTASRNFISADRVVLPPYNSSVHILVANSGIKRKAIKILRFRPV